MSKRIKCPLCPKSYESFNNLQKHIRRIHNIEQEIDSLCIQCDQFYSYFPHCDSLRCPLGQFQQQLDIPE